MRASSPAKLLSLAAAFAVAAAAATVGFGLWFMDAPARPGDPARRTIEIARGDGPRAVSAALAREGVVRDGWAFLLAGRALGLWSGLRAGEYELGPGMAPREIFAVLRSGIGVQRAVTVREGENIHEVARALAAAGRGREADILAELRTPAKAASLWAAAGLARLAPAPRTLEGFLSPETYFYERRHTARELIVRMLRRFGDGWGAEQDARARALGLDVFRVVTLASVVEKETGAASERPLIASVFHNRLAKRMRLQSDPTTIYGIWDRYDGNLRRADLLAPTPYNTYAVPGLPVGPISNPGRPAIEAVLAPARSDFLFFVSRNDGTHRFSRTLAEHNQAVRDFQLNAAARAGKSWRDLSARGAGGDARKPPKPAGTPPPR